MAAHTHILIRQCSPSSFLLITPTKLHLKLSTRYDIIRHGVRVYSHPPGFNNGNVNDDDGEFVRRRSRSGWWNKKMKKKAKKRWWSDEVEDMEANGGIIEQAVDNLWILQVFRSYGLFLPVILISLLFATGPKAFLIGSGIPFGLSALLFAFKKLSEWIFDSHKPRRRSRPKSRSRGKQDGNTSRSRANKPRDRVHGDDSRMHDRNDPDMNGFGGWDELVKEEKTKSAQRAPQKKGRVEMMTENVKMHRKVKEKDAPLLLRLLVAVFPFLGSWTNLL